MKTCLLLFLISFSYLADAYVPDQKPMIFNITESAAPGETFGLQGVGFGEEPVIWISPVSTKPVKPRRKLLLLTGGDSFASSQIPASYTSGQYVVWVERKGQLSNPVFLNQPRITQVEFNELMPGTICRVFGRNLSLPGYKTLIKFRNVANGASTTAKVLNASPFEIRLQTPLDLKPGDDYDITVMWGGEGSYSGTTFDEAVKIRQKGTDPFRLELPWGADFNFSANVYNVKTDVRLRNKATGDGQHNDRQAIQEAIDSASLKGGVVFLPAGSYKLVYSTGTGLTMRSNVVLKGEGPERTHITYGYGRPFSTERVKASYGWTLGWPDSRTEGMAVLFPGGITTSGLLDISFENVNTSHEFVHTLKNMPEGGSKVFFKNCHFNLSSGWGLAMVNIDRLLIAECHFKSTAMQVRNLNGPTRTWPWDLKNSHHIIFRNNVHSYRAGRFGANGCHHAIFENNTFIRDGSHQAKGETGGLSLDYTEKVVVSTNRFEVRGGEISNGNQGETILSQGSNPHQQNIGTVSSATALSVSDRNKEFQDLTDRVSTDWQYAVHPANYAIAIISGPGTGQWRRAVANTDTTITIDRPWDLVPGIGSRFVVTQWSACQMLVKDNVLTGNNRGIWFYSGLFDVAIVNNTLLNSEGIYLRSDQRLTSNRYNLCWNALIQGNKVLNTEGSRPAYIDIFLAQAKSEQLTGTGILGVTVRDNVITATVPNVNTGFTRHEGYMNLVNQSGSKGGSASGTIPGILGTIFDQNSAVNTDQAYQTGAGAHYTVIIPARNENVKSVYSDVVNETHTGSLKTHILIR